MRPRAYKVDGLTQTIDRAELHEIACEFAETEFDRRGAVPFVWLIATAKLIFWLETPWENEMEKALSIALVRTLLFKFNAHAYAQVFEAWVACYDADENGIIENDEVLPGDLPESERDNVLVVTSADRGGNHAFTRYLVTTRQRGGNLLGPRADEDMSFSGRMFDLFKEPRQ